MLTLCGLAAGCTTTPVYLDHQVTLDVKDTLAANPCRLNLIGIRDARRTTELGQVAGRAVRSEDILEWLTQGLEQIDIRPGGDNDPSKPTFDVEIVLLTVHARSVSTSMCCDVVLEAVFLREQETVASKRYRGSCTRINWASGTDEIQRCFDLALQDALIKLHEHGLSVCNESHRTR
jgi:hypothetical protein